MAWAARYGGSNWPGVACQKAYAPLDVIGEIIGRSDVASYIAAERAARAARGTS